MVGGAIRDGVRDRIHDRGDRSGGAGFAGALDPERIGGRRNGVHHLAQFDRHVVGVQAPLLRSTYFQSSQIYLLPKFNSFTIGRQYHITRFVVDANLSD